jgi:hypothetical protein
VTGARRALPVLLLAAAATAAACVVGPRASTYEPALTARGTSCRVTVQRPRRTLEGELLALQDTAALLVMNRKVWLIPYRGIRDSNCRSAGPIIFDRRSGRLRAEQATSLRLRSRYPQGVSDELLRRLLAAYAQSELMMPGTTP